MTTPLSNTLIIEERGKHLAMEGALPTPACPITLAALSFALSHHASLLAKPCGLGQLEGIELHDEKGLMLRIEAPIDPIALRIQL